MSKKLFSSLLLGFGSTLAVLVAISMPPGGWGVAVGVALGLLAAVPLFLVLMALIRRQPQYPPEHPANYGGYREPQMPPVVIIQQQLPQGQAMPLPPNAYGYNQAQYDDYALEQADYYGYDQNGQEYLPAEQMLDPRLLKQARRRQREVPIKRRRSQNQVNQGYVQDNRYLDYPQNYEQPGYEQEEVNPSLQEAYANYYDENYYNEPVGQSITPPDLAYYEEQQLRRRRNAYRYSVKAANENNNNRYYTTNNQQYNGDDTAGQVVDGEFREINFYGED